MNTNHIPPHEIPQNPYHRRAWALARLHQIGINFTDLARELETSTQAVSGVFLFANERIEDRVAAKLGLTARELFPDRFDADGSRIVRARIRLSTNRRIARERSKAKA